MVALFKHFTKSAPVYLPPNSCHDPTVFKGFYKGIGQRLRLNCSRDEDYYKAVDDYSRALAVCGHNYQKARSGLLECKNMDRIKYLTREEGVRRYFKKNNKNTNKIFWISPFDPRLPHQRTLAFSLT